MSATDELRKLLDERGVEHYDGTETTLWLKDGIGYRASADEGLNGFMQLHLWCTTPEQAIAATLGRGTCEPDEAGYCPYCGEDLVRCDVGIGAGAALSNSTRRFTTTTARTAAHAWKGGNNERLYRVSSIDSRHNSSLRCGGNGGVNCRVVVANAIRVIEETSKLCFRQVVRVVRTADKMNTQDELYNVIRDGMHLTVYGSELKETDVIEGVVTPLIAKKRRILRFRHTRTGHQRTARSGFGKAEKAVERIRW